MDGYDVFVSKARRNQNDGVIVYVNKCFAVSCEEVRLYSNKSFTCVDSEVAQRLLRSHDWSSVLATEDVDVACEEFVRQLQEITNNQTLEEDSIKKIADAFNDYYVDVGANLARGVPQVLEPVINDDDFQTDTTFQLSPVGEAELSTVVRGMRGGSAPGADNIPAPICVVGMTTRIDVTELLEKRVKSRFSHRTILLLPAPTDIERMQLFKSLLCIESESGRRKDKFVQNWNSSVNNLCGNSEVKEVVEKLLFHDISEKSFRSFLLYLVSQLSVSNTTGASLTAEDVLECYENWSQDDKVSILQGLSTLELCLVIAICHQMELYDEVPFNFEMILQRYLNFARQSHSVKIGERSVILKAFERIQALELIIPVSGMAGRSGLKEYQMYNFILRKDQVQKAIQAYPGLQTDVIQWSKSSLD
ncbi:origin recognition complex subunit 4-like [Macrosteles quadrilineatus]|uniref:origin recognition complex subunit 4-like n=1 Tax=Macrosteles quadrilineatus TaxID=74068 RepID=UPI0023E0D270|nr:origin recognition complex subunit 4-like [Macrosteles quadrilineatus]